MTVVFFFPSSLHLILLLETIEILERSNLWCFFSMGRATLLSHPYISFPSFHLPFLTITHVRMCVSIWYHSFASFHLSALKIAANGWDMGIRYSENYVRYVPDEKLPQIPQSASAAVKCNPSTSGFAHRECLSNGIIFSRIDRWNTALSCFAIVTRLFWRFKKIWPHFLLWSSSIFYRI